MADKPFRRAIPAPLGFAALQVNAAEPSIDAVQVDVIGPAIENVNSGLGDRDATQAVFHGVRYLNQRMRDTR